MRTKIWFWSWPRLREIITLKILLLSWSNKIWWIVIPHPKTISNLRTIRIQQSEFCSDLFLAFPVSANNGQTSGTCLLTPLQNVVDFFEIMIVVHNFNFLYFFSIHAPLLFTNWAPIFPSTNRHSGELNPFLRKIFWGKKIFQLFGCFLLSDLVLNSKDFLLLLMLFYQIKIHW